LGSLSSKKKKRIGKKKKKKRREIGSGGETEEKKINGITEFQDIVVRILIKDIMINSSYHFGLSRELKSYFYKVIGFFYNLYFILLIYLNWLIYHLWVVIWIENLNCLNYLDFKNCTIDHLLWILNINIVLLNLH
jgi:hypothetical protein